MMDVFVRFFPIFFLLLPTFVFLFELLILNNFRCTATFPS